jgi:hypothetical protein
MSSRRDTKQWKTPLKVALEDLGKEKEKSTKGKSPTTYQLLLLPWISCHKSERLTHTSSAKGKPSTGNIVNQFIYSVFECARSIGSASYQHRPEAARRSGFSW